MNKIKKESKTGGQFLVEPISMATVYSREDFTEEHIDIYNLVMEFDRDQVLAQKEEIDQYNPDLVKSLIKEMGKLGLLGIDVPETYGGINLDKITTIIVAESLVQCPSFSVTWGVQTGIGSLPIVWFGTEEQKQKFLPKIVTGEILCAYGLTEPSAGSDATNGKTTAVLSKDGEHYILNGEKIFITNGNWANVYTVFAQIDGDKFSAFIIERGTEGFSIGQEEKKLGMKGSSTTPLIFENAKVPVKNLLFKVGEGANIAFNCLNIGRLKLGASSLGGSKMVINGVTPYAKERRAFGQPISKLDAITKKIADMTIRTFVTDSMLYRTVGLIQSEIDQLDIKDDNYYIQMGEAMEKFAIETSMAKVFGSDTSHIVIDEGLQILGGYGFLEEYPLAGAYRDDRINQIWEGTNEVNRQIISGFMMKKALMEELPIREAIREIDAFMSNGELDLNNQILSTECQTIEIAKRFVLFIFNEALCKYGQDLKHEQQLTEIFADNFMDIYTAESTVVRARKIMASNSPEPTVVDIAKVFTAEMANRFISQLHTAISAICDGKPSVLIDQKINEFESRIRLSTNVIGLKRNIANHVYKKNRYPY
jgi:alkylation response protein AidB-like acyl-CoA dehydrogenase|tara:strand:- start:4029 stop:5810 length:1782 start_codon:yes stop_codon:yes gene_type:complete